MALGFSVGDPVGPGTEVQTTSEVFFRFQLNPNFAATASLQVIGNPPNNPNEARG